MDKRFQFLYIMCMNVRHFILLMTALVVPSGLQSQGESYHHPVYEISFEASPDWTEPVPYSQGGKYSVINPNHNMQISLGYVPQCKRPLKYMRKLSGLKGLVCLRDGYDTILNDHEALILFGNCLEKRESYATMVIGFPKEDGLYLMEISCPENCQTLHFQRLQAILNSVRVGKVSAI